MYGNARAGRWASVTAADSSASVYWKGVENCSLSERGELVVAGFVDLDEVGAVFDLLADDVHDSSALLGVGGVREDTLFGVVTDGVFMAAEDVDGITADAQRGPGMCPCRWRYVPRSRLTPRLRCPYRVRP